MTKSTRRRTLCATCGNSYNSKGDHKACPYCSGAKKTNRDAKKLRPNRHGFVNYGGAALCFSGVTKAPTTNP